MILCLTRRIALCCVLAAGVAACGGRKQQAPEVECEFDEDCASSDECVSNECVEREIVEARGKSNNITPMKVRREVEKRQKVHTDKVDKSLDL